MHLRVVNHDIQSQSLHRETANRGEQRVRSDDAIMLRGHQSHARIHQFLLRIEDVERCALTFASWTSPDAAAKSLIRVLSLVPAERLVCRVSCGCREQATVTRGVQKTA